MKVIFLDRDGVINRDSVSYVKSVEEFVFLPGSLQSIVRLTQAGYKIGIATNQSGVSRGFYTEKTLQAIHVHLLKEVNTAGGAIHSIVYCKHLPEEDCDCRKPKAGMLRTLAEQMNCSFEHAVFAGDRISDIQAALAVGLKPIMILSSMTDKKELYNYPDVPVYPSLAKFVDEFLTDE